MADTEFSRTAPGTILGFRLDGRPIYPIAGGSDDDGGDDGDKGTDDGKGGDSEKDDLPDPVKEVLRKERAARADAEKANKALTRRLEALENANKPEAERIKAEIAANAKRADDAETALLRFRVAARNKVPEDLADRLRGDTEAELEADAKALMSRLAPAGDDDGDKGDKRPPKGDAGSRGKGPQPTMNDLLRAAVAGR